MNKAQSILAAINVAGFILITVIAFMAVKFGNEWSKAMMENILPLLVGCWIVNVTTIINFVFGSSQGGQTNRETINKIVEKSMKLPPTVPVDLTNPASN
jgi:hypothetical protein